MMEYCIIDGLWMCRKGEREAWIACTVEELVPRHATDAEKRRMRMVSTSKRNRLARRRAALPAIMQAQEIIHLYYNATVIPVPRSLLEQLAELAGGKVEFI